ncbi:MAG: hypothetical protein K2O88_08775, partial [Paramuribaculum sp.]|nr:hypothetical protein [Paramuribaculum sp.]
DPTPNVTAAYALPVGYELPDINPGRGTSSYPCLDSEDTEILLGYQIGFDASPEPEPHTAKHAVA